MWSLFHTSALHPTVATRVRPPSLLARHSSHGSLYSIVLGPTLLQAPIFHPAAECPVWSSYDTATFLARSSLKHCRYGTRFRPSDGGGTLLPGLTIAFVPRPQLPAAPYGQMQVPRSVLGCSDRLLVRHFLGNYLGLRHGFCLFWS
jgi:hypothetical protein